MKFVKDTSKVRSFSAGGVKETGAYTCTITKAYINQSKSSASESLHLDVVTNKGQYAQIDMWYLSREGVVDEKSVAMSQINDLQVLLEIEELESKKGKVKIWDWDLKEEVEHVKMIFPELLNREIGCLFEWADKIKQVNIGGKWQDDPLGTIVKKLEFRMFYDSETMASAGEFLSDAEPESVERYLNILLENKHIIKQATNQPNAPVKDAVQMDDDDLDDIPF